MGLYSLRRKVGSPPLPARCGPRSAWGPRRAAPGLGAAVPSAHRSGSPGLWQRTRAGRCSAGTCERHARGRRPRTGWRVWRTAALAVSAQTPECAPRSSVPQCCLALRCEAAPLLTPPDGEAAGLPAPPDGHDPVPALLVPWSYFYCRLCASIYLLKLLWSICKGPTQTFRRVAQELPPRAWTTPLWVPTPTREDQGEGGRGPGAIMRNVTAVRAEADLCMTPSPACPSVLAASRARCRDGEGARGVLRGARNCHTWEGRGLCVSLWSLCVCVWERV